MRLFFHNLLMCPEQKCQLNGFPLKIEVIKTKYKESPYNKNKILKKLNSDKGSEGEQKHGEKTSLSNIRSWLFANPNERRPFSSLLNKSDE